MGVCFDERGVFSRDDLAAHHFWPVKARRLYAPSLRSLPDNHAYLPLFFFVRHYDRFLAHHVLSHHVATIHLVRNIGLHQNH